MLFLKYYLNFEKLASFTKSKFNFAFLSDYVFQTEKKNIKRFFIF